MAKYRYVAVDDKGKTRRGVLEAVTYDAAVSELRRQELWVLKLFNQAESILYRDLELGGPRVKHEHFTVFCRQLATMYKSGVNLVEALRILAVQTESKVFRKIINAMAADIHEGSLLSTASEKYPTVFSTVFVSMIRAGEASGKLDEVLNRLAEFNEKEYYTKQKVQSALLYPGVMAVVAAVVVTLMMTLVVPNYVASFESVGMELPLPTRIVLAVSDWINGNFILFLLLMLLPWIMRYVIRKSEKGLYMWDSWKLKVPVFGTLYQKQAVARFSRTFSSLYTASIPMLQSLKIVSEVAGNEAIRKLILDARESVGNGLSIVEPFRRSNLFPPMVVQMLALGEKTGELDGMLGKAADFYEADVDTMADRMKALVEPLMIVVMSVVIGGIIVAILLPMFEMMGNMEGIA